MELYKPFKSKAKNKKYSVYVKGGKLIHFGDKRYGQYKDDRSCAIEGARRACERTSVCL